MLAEEVEKEKKLRNLREKRKEEKYKEKMKEEMC